MSQYQDYGWQHAGPSNSVGGHELAELFCALAKQKGAGLKVCDLGSGNGYMAGMLARNGFEVVGVDASEKGIELARANFPQAQFIRRELSAELGDTVGRDFDLVISNDVIEHLYRPADLLEAARAVLKPKGLALIGTPYHGYLKNLALAVTGKMDAHLNPLWDGGHIKFFSIKTLSELLRQQRFAVSGWSYFGRAQWLWKGMIAHAQKLD
jgi:2-polyprenyl-3-methyl-5-hydroxy-6-metoxy-1,4-benzoquinol methylase